MGEEGGGRSCGTTRELQKLKQQAMEYYQQNDVPRRLEELLNSTFYLQPDDVYGHLANCFAELAKPPTICKVVGKKVLDGLGLPTLQVEIFCIIQNFPKNICSVVISSHFEVLENALPELVEAEELERSKTISTAVQWVNYTITEVLQGMEPSNQAEVDQLLRTFFENKLQEDQERKELENMVEDSTLLPLVPPPPPPPPPAKKKGQKQGGKDTLPEKPVLPEEPAEPVLCGSMAIGAVSLAVAKTSAILRNNPLYLTIALLKHNQEQPKKLTVPLLMVSLVSCGKSSPGKLNLMKEVICIPHPGLSTKQGVEMLLEIQKHINKTIEAVLSSQLQRIATLCKTDRNTARSSTILTILAVLEPIIAATMSIHLVEGLHLFHFTEHDILLQGMIPSDNMTKPPPPKTETKKGHNGAKRGQQQITGKMSHLGCLTVSFDTIEQPILLIQGICANLGLELGTNLHLAINCAAHELMDYSKGKYEVMTGTLKSAAEMVDLYVDLINKYPSIIALIDPFRKEDSEQWGSIYNALGSGCYIIAGTASKSITKLLKDGNISVPRASGLIIKHTNQTTMSDLVAITNFIDSRKHLAVFGSTEGESSDDSLVDLAVGLGVRFIKLGGLSRGERVTKYNRLLTIEEELGQNGTLHLIEEHTFVHFNEEAAEAPEAATATDGKLPEPIFPTEVAEESAHV